MASKINNNLSFIMGSLVVTSSVPSRRKIIITTDRIRSMRSFTSVPQHCDKCEQIRTECLCGQVDAFFVKAIGTPKK